MSSKEMLEHLADMKIPAKSASSTLEDAYVSIVRKKLKPILEARAAEIEAEKKAAAEKGKDAEQGAQPAADPDSDEDAGAEPQATPEPEADPEPAPTSVAALYGLDDEDDDDEEDA